MADGQQSPGLLANILAVAGFIILIVIIVWGAYHLLRLTGSGVSSLFSRFGKNGDAITLTVPQAPVQSGKSFPLSWKYSPSESGTYAVLYQCKSGFRFDATSPSGAMSAIPCGNAFTVGSATNIVLTPVLSGTTTVDVPVSVVYMPSATSSSSRPQGTGIVKVTAGTTAAATTKPTAGSNQTTGAPASSGTVSTVPAGPADLSVKIIGVGVIDPASGAFVNRPPMNPNEIAAVRFDIGNIGGKATGTWYFSVQLPTNPAYTYTSPAQSSLSPDGHIVNTLRFRPMNPGGGTVFVRIDPQNAVKESNESNNSASMWLNAGQWSGYPYQAPYAY